MVGTMNPAPQHLDQPVTRFIRHDFAKLRETMTTREALAGVVAEVLEHDVGLAKRSSISMCSMRNNASSACFRPAGC